MPITPDTLRLEKQLRDALDGVLDEQTRDLVTAWARAWDEVAPDLDAALSLLVADAADGQVSRALVLRNRRLQRSLGVIAEQLDDLATSAGLRISTNIRDVVDRAGREQAAIIASQMPDVDLVDLESWSRVDPAAIDAIVRRSTEQITSLTYPIGDDAYDVVRRELVRGVAVGSNPKDTAARMLRRSEQGFNGGLARAINIARTETVDAHRAGAAAGQEPHTDVLTGWTWLAQLGPRTCIACLGMHGRDFPASEPGPLGHQQCRCSRAPKAMSWADLGFDGLDEPDDAVEDAEKFFRGLPETDQRAIMGPSRFRAWKAGRFPRDEWAARRSNDGWRDSYVPGKPGQGPVKLPSQQPSGTGGTPIPSRPLAAPGGGQPPSQPPSAGDTASQDAPVPIGDRVEIRDESTRDVVERNTELIGQVHLVPGSMTKVTTKAVSEAMLQLKPGLQGFYVHNSVVSPELQVKVGGARADITVVHELGHALDDLVFGPATSHQDTGATINTAEFADWKAAVDATDAVQAMREMLQWQPTDGAWSVLSDPDGRRRSWSPDHTYVRYALSTEELFGRSYAQWIATVTGDTRLREQLALDLQSRFPTGWSLISGRAPFYPVSWSDEDFVPVSEALTAVFVARGLAGEGESDV